MGDYEAIVDDLVAMGFMPEGGDRSGLVEPLGVVLSQLSAGGGAANVNIDLVMAKIEEVAEKYPIQVGLLVSHFIDAHLMHSYARYALGFGFGDRAFWCSHIINQCLLGVGYFFAMCFKRWEGQFACMLLVVENVTGF